MRVLGIETSCDDTAFAVLDGRRTVLSSVVSSQTSLHRAYGGIVPELARAITGGLEGLLEKALEDARITLADIDGSRSRQARLIGALWSRLFRQALAWSAGKPLAAVNHLEGHVRALPRVP